MSERLGLRLLCPACGYRTDRTAAVGPRPAVPKAGDATICLRCGQLLLFALDFIGLRLQLPTTTQMRDLRADPQIVQLEQAWAAAFHRVPERRTA